VLDRAIALLVTAMSRLPQCAQAWTKVLTLNASLPKLPGHGLATPVEKAAVGVDSEFIDGGQQMAGHIRGRVDV